MIPRICLALRQEFLGKHIYHLVVFSVNLDKCSDLFCLFKHLVENSVLNAEIINHKHLKRRHTVFYSISDGINKVSAHILYRNMV